MVLALFIHLEYDYMGSFSVIEVVICLVCSYYGFIHYEGKYLYLTWPVSPAFTFFSRQWKDALDSTETQILAIYLQLHPYRWSLSISNHTRYWYNTVLRAFPSTRQRVSVQSLEEKMSAAQTDEEKYNLLWGWLAERFDQLLEGAGEVVKALELTKIITNFSALRKNDKSFWNNAGGLKRQYLKSGEITGRQSLIKRLGYVNNSLPLGSMEGTVQSICLPLLTKHL